VAKIFDLSVPLIDGAQGEPDFPPRSPPRITYYDHEDNKPSMHRMFGIPPDKLPHGLAWASEYVQLSTHAGTHCDAPYHYSPTTDGGRTRSMTIDEVPLDWFYGPGVVLDFTHKAAEAEITAADVDTALARIGYNVQPNDIVLFRTDAYRLWPGERYQFDFPGVSMAAARTLIDRGVRVMGVDAYNFDMPFPAQRRLFEETGDPNVIEPCHIQLGAACNYLHIEKLANLDKLPSPTGFTFCAFPVKIEGASGGWCRAVAIFN
jgi:kynurenine formamidase